MIDIVRNVISDFPRGRGAKIVTDFLEGGGGKI